MEIASPCDRIVREQSCLLAAGRWFRRRRTTDRWKRRRVATLFFTRRADAAYQEVSPDTRRNVWLLRLGDRTKQPFLRTRATEGAARFSPDGRWIAYVSDESGKPEVYVQALPPSTGKWQVSTDGGTEPAWNRNGRELFFRSGDRVMAADVSTQPTFSSGRPRMLFQGKYVRSDFPLTGFAYDVSSDGQRFLMVEETGGNTAAQINVVLNWAEELKRRVPMKR
jgi:hypothetical protein